MYLHCNRVFHNVSYCMNRMQSRSLKRTARWILRHHWTMWSPTGKSLQLQQQLLRLPHGLQSLQWQMGKQQRPRSSHQSRAFGPLWEQAGA